MKFSSPFLLSLASLSAAQGPLVDLLSSQPDLSTLLDILTITPEFVNTLSQANNITILAPVNSAFAAIPPDTAEGLAISTRDPNGTNTLLNYHIMRGQYPSSAFTEIPTYYPTLFDNRSIIFDNPRTNVTGGQNVGLVRNNTQFQLISGELQTSNVIEADITQIPGITIHKIDEVLTIPLNASDMAERLSATALLGALTTANLADTLDIVPDLTLFIPTNDAFAAVASALEGASIDTVRSLLQYHAVTGAVVFSTDITNTTVQASNGGQLTLSVIDGDVFVNQARVVIPNVLLSDGVAHVIDGVLNPADTSFDRNTIDDDDDAEVAFPGASGSGAVPFTSAVPAPTTINTVPPVATTASAINGTLTRAPTGTGAGGVSPTGTGVTSFTGAAVPTAMVGKAVWAGMLAAGAWELGF